LVFGAIETCLPVQKMSAYDFIDESNPIRMIDVFVDALDLAEMSFEGVEPPATGRPSYHPSSEFSSSGISMLRGHDDQFEAPCLLRAYPWQRPSGWQGHLLRLEVIEAFGNPLFQHLWRQLGVLRRGPCGSESHQGRPAAGADQRDAT
jgi:hypothetical protein